jgi:hypothetical protein
MYLKAAWVNSAERQHESRDGRQDGSRGEALDMRLNEQVLTLESRSKAAVPFPPNFVI